MKIVKVLFPLPIDKTFDYKTKLPVKKGARVLVDFRGKKIVGMVYDFEKTSVFKEVKEIISILDKEPLITREHFKLVEALVKKYPYLQGEFFFMFFPSCLGNRKINLVLDKEFLPSEKKEEIIYIKKNYFIERYNFYREEIKKALKEGSVIVFFPQIDLLEKARKIFEKDFSSFFVFHSALSKKEQLKIWLNSRKKSLILSTRRGIFLYPLDLKLIIIEEESSLYYQEEQKPFYHLLEVARIIIKLKKIKLILSDFSPSLEAYFLIKKGKISLLEQKEQEEKDFLPFIVVERKFSLVSPLLKEILRKHLSEGKRIVIFYNRKGKGIGVCLGCGYVMKCPRCFSFLKLLAKEEKWICTYCGFFTENLKICPNCKGYIKIKGTGQEKIEEELKREFPEIKFSEGEDDLNAQVIFSRFKFLNILSTEKKFEIALVLDIDLFLNLIDYEATFKSYLYLKALSLLFKEKIYIFTQNKDYYLFNFLDKNWKNFYEKEIYLRKKLNLPPYSNLIKIIFRAKNKFILYKKVEKFYNNLKEKISSVYGPLEEVPFYIYGRYHYSVLIKSKNNYFLHTLLKESLNEIKNSSLKIAIKLD